MIKKFFKLLIKLMFIIIVLMLLINLFVLLLTFNKIDNEFNNDMDCILILGAGIVNNKPSLMLKDRLDKGYELYKNGVSKKILVSGDHISNDYNEVVVMKDYLINLGVSSSDIYVDHAGISTYDSIYRAKNIYNVKKMVIVTQKYHLYRALYIGKMLDINVVGADSTKQIYVKQFMRNVREFFARIKDFVKCFYKPSSKYLGEIISLDYSGEVTHYKRNY